MELKDKAFNGLVRDENESKDFWSLFGGWIILHPADVPVRNAC